MRFPLALPVVFNIDKSEFPAQTRNVSASGVLFALDRELTVGPISVSRCGCPARYWAQRTIFWFTVRDVWYAAL